MPEDVREDKVEEFIQKLRSYHTTLNVFIKLFNMWSMLNVKERDRIIKSELKEF